MAATASSRRSPNGPVLRSPSPSGKFNYFSSSTSFASSSSSFAARSSTFFGRQHQDHHHHHHHHHYQRSASPTRVNLYGSAPSARSVRFSLDRPISPNRSISTVSPSRTRHHHHHHHHHQVVRKQSAPQRTCLCSPTTHPGSFRCSLHKGFNNSQSVNYSSNNRLNARRSAMTNSLVRIGGVEGDLVKRALSALIRPSSHQQRRRADFRPRPSRLSVMSRAEDS